MEALESPHDAGTVWFVNCFATSTREDPNLCCVAWNWDFADDIGSEVTLFKDGLYPDAQFYLVLVGIFLYHGDDLEGKVDVLRDSICHYIEDTIRRNKSDRSVSVKSTETNTLMEFYIIDLNSFV